MREGRRQRLGLQEGTEGTVQDTYLDRILEQEGPRTLALDPDAFVDTRDQRYVQDAYNYYLGGGFPQEAEPVIDTPVIDTTPVVDVGGGGGGQDLATGGVDLGGNTDFEQNLIDQGIGVQAEPGAPISAPGEGMLTQEAIDDLADYPVTPVNEFPTGDAGLAEQIAAEDRAAQLANVQDPTNMLPQLGTDTPTVFDDTATLEDAGAIGDMNMPGSDYFPDYGMPQGSPGQLNPESLDAPYGVNPDTGIPYQTPRTIADQNRVLGQTFETDEVDQQGNLLQKGVDKLREMGIDPFTTALSLGVNTLVDFPLSLVAKVVSGRLPDGIETTTNKAREIGLIQGDNTVTQDIYGINTQSAFGDYNQYAVDKAEELQTKFDNGDLKQYNDDGSLTYLGEKQAKYANYVQSSGALGDIDDDPTGDAQIAEQIEADNRAAEADRIEAERRALQEINAAAAREQAAAEQRARDETDARMAAEAASRAAAAAAAAAANRRSGDGGGQNTGGARGGGTSATSSGLGNLGFSDIRLKDNVELIGKSPSNINIYKFNYKGNSTVYEGVIANEVPWASVEASNGYLMVDYNKIDVELKKHAKR